MDIAVGKIDRRAERLARGAEGVPFGASEDLEDQHAGPHATKGGTGQWLLHWPVILKGHLTVRPIGRTILRLSLKGV